MESHAYSRDWREAELGEELMIYCDPVPDDEYRATQASMKQIADALGLAWKESGGNFSDTKR